MNQTVDESSVPLVFSVKVLSVDKTVDWTGYCLDGQCNITLAGDTTLTGLSSGLHRLVVYANDTFGNMGASGILIFTIQQPMPLITALAFGGVVVAVLAVVGTVIYFRTRHRTA